MHKLGNQLIAGSQDEQRNKVPCIVLLATLLQLV